MAGDVTAGYLGKLPADQQAELARVNEPGLVALRRYLASGEAVAFLGAEYQCRCTHCGTG